MPAARVTPAGLAGVPPAVAAFAAAVATGLLARGAIGAWGIFPLLGVFPGVALATLLPLERNPLARWALGLAASPLVATSLAWTLQRAGLPLPDAARAVAAVAAAAWALAEWRLARGADAGESGRQGMRFAWTFAAAGAAVIGFVLFVNPYLQVRADAWIHAGIVVEILERGIPPEDPRFAGLTLNYVWFHNYYVALLSSLRGGDPFAFMAIANVSSMFSTLAIAWLVGRGLWDSSRAAAGAAWLMALAFNAGMWLLWPLRLVRAVTGEVGGIEEARRILASGLWNEARVIYELSPPFTHMVSFLDKPLHGTAINVAYVFLIVHLWATVRAVRDGGAAPLAWAALAAAGMFFFHGVVAMSAVPAALGALGATWLLAGRVAWLPRRGRTVELAAATLAGSLVAAPYTIAISKAWPASQSGLQHSYLRPDPIQWLTLLTALAVPAYFARGALRRLVAERRAAAAAVALFAGAMLAFACVVTLPIGSHAKFVYQVFIGLAALGGAAFHDELAAWRRRFGPGGAAALVAVVLAGTPLITLRGYLVDRSAVLAPEHPMAPGEPGLHAWIAAATPREAVFVDRGFRDAIMVLGRRQLLLGSRQGPELAAFPLAEIRRRRAVMDALYAGAGPLDDAVAYLRALGRPAYVVVRASDERGGAAPGARFEARPDLFARAYGRDGFLVYHVLPSEQAPAPSPDPARP